MKIAALPYILKQAFITIARLGSFARVSGQEASIRVEAFMLVDQGKPDCSIVTAENPSPAARLAALELQFHSWKISGANIPIRVASERVGGRRILV